MSYISDYFTLVHHYRRGLKTAGEKREFARKTLVLILNDPKAPQSIKAKVFPLVAEWVQNVG